MSENSDSLEKEPSGSPESFGSDLSRSLRVLVTSPLLVGVALITWTGPTILLDHPSGNGAGTALFALLLILIGIGLRGAIRVWFWRADRGEPNATLAEFSNIIYLRQPVPVRTTDENGRLHLELATTPPDW
jgi:hypothetical protein